MLDPERQPERNSRARILSSLVALTATLPANFSPCDEAQHRSKEVEFTGENLSPFHFETVAPQAICSNYYIANSECAAVKPFHSPTFPKAASQQILESRPETFHTQSPQRMKCLGNWPGRHEVETGSVEIGRPRLAVLADPG